jgi:UDP-N-acetylglucosamine 2-epimerase (non-hydrolysing)
MISSKKRHYIVILGARPNFVKAAAFFKGAREYPNMSFTVVHTGQHFDENMSRIFFEQMNIPKPDIQLSVEGMFHTERIGRMFNSLQKTLGDIKNDGVIVFGDVNSTLAGALATLKTKSKLIHIEAGLRSHDRRMPEEINRVIIDHISDALFTTEPDARENLLREGIDEKIIYPVGNLMIESIELFQPHVDQSVVMNELCLEKQSYVIATVHRQENTDNSDMLEKILHTLNYVSAHTPVVFPLHPGTKHKIKEYGIESLLENLKIVEPLGYFDFMRMVRDSGGVITDSGGIQEETTHLGVPCATLRDNTERPVTLYAGSNKLFSVEHPDIDAIIAHISRRDFPQKPVEMWDNKVSSRILRILDQL